MNLAKSYEYFAPEKDTSRLHIIGCGSVGSTLAENLARCGLTNFTLYDFDRVEQHNIVNQMFRAKDVGRLKVDALRDILVEINEECETTIQTKPQGWQGKLLSGYIFLCVDNIELRREIVEKHMNSPFVKVMYDFRTGLESAQHYAALWEDPKAREDFLNSMSFSHDEAKTEVSACGVTLGLCPTVRVICAYGAANHINFVNGKGLKKMVAADIFGMNTLAF